MAKKEKKSREKKGRTPTLAAYVDAPFKIYARSGGKDFEAQVLKSGMIVFESKEYTSPSSAGMAVLRKTSEKDDPQVDGWSFWKFNKDGGRVALNILRGKDSPLKVAKTKSARTKSVDKPKRVRKPRAKKVEQASTEAVAAQA